MATITARVSKGELVSREATIGITVIPGDEEEGSPGGDDGSPAPEPQPGDTPLVPSLTEWLVNDDEAIPGGATTVTTPSGLTSALSSAGPGDTIVCNPSGGSGTIAFWGIPAGLTIPSGSSGNFVTIVAAQNKGVVISAGEDFAGARTPNNGFWTQSGLSADDIDKHIWRSVGTFSGGEQTMMGFWVEFGQPHQLLRAINMTNLRNPYTQGSGNVGNESYAAPCVHKASDGRVYIRMQKPHPVKYSRDNKWSETTFPGFPEAITGGQLDYPKSQDPNDYVIYLFRNANQIAFDPGASGHHVRIGNGINSMGFENAFAGASFIQGGRGLHLTWRHFINVAVTDRPKDNYYFNRMRCSDGCKIHMWEWKSNSWQVGIRSAWFEMFNSSTASNIYCKDCTIGHYHDVVVANQHLSGMRFRNCTWVFTLDDGFQTRHSQSRCELGYCYLHYSDWGGQGEAGVDGSDADPGEWYVHHNIIDCRREKVTNWRAQPFPQDVHTAHSPDGNAPKKIYNNILLCGPDRPEEFGIGFEHCPQGAGGGNNTLNGAANTHQVFNNIIMLDHIEGTKRYDPVVTNPNAQYSDNFVNRSDFIGNRQNRYSAELSNELQDYNCYWRPSTMSVNGRYRNQRGAGQTVTLYSNLAAWYNSAEFDHSKLSGARRPAYSPGWEGNSTETKPIIPGVENKTNAAQRHLYRPSPTSAVTVATNNTSLNGQNWWSSPPTWGDDYFPWNDGERRLQPHNYKGPLDPNGSTMPVGVLNP